MWADLWDGHRTNASSSITHRCGQEAPCFNPCPFRYQEEPDPIQWGSYLHITLYKGWKATAPRISATLKSTICAEDNHPLAEQTERFFFLHERNNHIPQVRDKKDLPVLSRFCPDWQNHATWDITGTEITRLNVWQLHCLSKKFKDAPIITGTLKSFRGIITVGVLTVLTAN